MSVLSGKRLEVAIINMFTELKKVMNKEVKEDMITISYQIENINKDAQLLE